MQHEELILIPPTHEQSLPSFHVAGNLAEPFIAFLRDKGISAWEPPLALDKKGPDSRRVVEIEVEADTPLDMLEGLIGEFLERRHALASD